MPVLMPAKNERLPLERCRVASGVLSRQSRSRLELRPCGFQLETGLFQRNARARAWQQHRTNTAMKNHELKAVIGIIT